MYFRSNIGASLNKKRHISFLKKIFAYFVFVLLLVSLAIWGLTTDKVRIKSITVSGNSSVSTSDILQIVNVEMNKYYLWIIPTNNIFLLRSDEIENDILSNIPKIDSVDISIQGIDKIEVKVNERQVEDLWCKSLPIDNPNDCYFMDRTGYIFEQAPHFSNGAFPEYLGLINSDIPIGQKYLENNFKNVSDLFAELKTMSFQPKYFNTIDENNYEIYISGGGKILMNDERGFDAQLTNLQALIDNGYIKTDAASLKNINYIDLRFGNKVAFELNK